MTDPRQYWIGFNLVKGIGAVRFQALVNYFGDAQTAWQASVPALQQCGLSQKIIENFLKVREQVDLERILQNILVQDIQVLTWDDAGYPARLKQIDQPPPVLYLKGDYCEADDWAVAVVGTRRVTAYGRQVTEELVTVLARHGITIVSGLARGVDAVAHQTALNVGGRTMGVLGSGVDRIYPHENRRIAELMAKQGAVISDYAVGTPPDALNFPPRNRIISGLSRAVVVIEAGESSGALITASFAADQGREVFAVPGNINAPQSIGTNRLIQKGARPLLEAKEILEALELTNIQEHRQARVILPADAVEAKLFQLLGREPLHVDEIRSQAGIPIEKVTATLALMELKGMVRQVGGMNYVSVREMQAEYQGGEA